MSEDWFVKLMVFSESMVAAVGTREAARLLQRAANKTAMDWLQGDDPSRSVSLTPAKPQSDPSPDPGK